MNYNYFEAVCGDVRDVIAESWADKFADFATLDEVREALNEELWSCDRVTGHASGAYVEFWNESGTCDSSPWLAEERLAHNWDVLEEACVAFGADMGEEVKKGAENADVLIRCYFLGAAIDKVLPDFEEDFNAAHGAPGTIKLKTIYSTKNGDYIVILRHHKYEWYGLYRSRFCAEWLEDFDYLLRERCPYFASYKSSAVRDVARKVMAGKEARDDV